VGSGGPVASHDELARRAVQVRAGQIVPALDMTERGVARQAQQSANALAARSHGVLQVQPETIPAGRRSSLSLNSPVRSSAGRRHSPDLGPQATEMDEGSWPAAPAPAPAAAPLSRVGLWPLTGNV
jgi:hypothetical protein